MNFFLSVFLLLSVGIAFDMNYGTGTSDKVQILFDQYSIPFSQHVTSGGMVTTQSNIGFVLQTPIDKVSTSTITSDFDVVEGIFAVMLKPASKYGLSSFKISSSTSTLAFFVNSAYPNTLSVYYFQTCLLTKDMGYDITADFHEFSIEIDDEGISWSFDGTSIYRLSKTDALSNSNYAQNYPYNKLSTVNNMLENDIAANDDHIYYSYVTIKYVNIQQNNNAFMLISNNDIMSEILTESSQIYSGMTFTNTLGLNTLTHITTYTPSITSSLSITSTPSISQSSSTPIISSISTGSTISQSSSTSIISSISTGSTIFQSSSTSSSTSDSTKSSISQSSKTLIGLSISAELISFNNSSSNTLVASGSIVSSTSFITKAVSSIAYAIKEQEYNADVAVGMNTINHFITSYTALFSLTEGSSKSTNKVSDPLITAAVDSQERVPVPTISFNGPVATILSNSANEIITSSSIYFPMTNVKDAEITRPTSISLLSAKALSATISSAPISFTLDAQLSTSYSSAAHIGSSADLFTPFFVSSFSSSSSSAIFSNPSNPNYNYGYAVGLENSATRNSISYGALYFTLISFTIFISKLGSFLLQVFYFFIDLLYF